MAQTIELGLDTFGDATVDAEGRPLSQAQAIRDVVKQGELADQLGLAFIGVGEHHRPDFSISAPEVVLAAIAARTTRIHLGSSVTVLSTDDPVRVFERFSTLDALSNGRAEVIIGRGSFTESFPLFGFDLNDYERLFEERIELFAELLKEKPVTWQGQTRASLYEQRVFPPTESGRLTTWVGVGGSPESAVRAARYGLPLMLAIIGGMLYFAYRDTPDAFFGVFLALKLVTDLGSLLPRTDTVETSGTPPRWLAAVMKHVPARNGETFEQYWARTHAERRTAGRDDERPRHRPRAR